MEWWGTINSGYEATVIGRLFLAAVLGSTIGLEREIHGRPAGFRTHLLVTVGACLMMLVSEFFFFRYDHIDSATVVRIDPARVAAQIVTGIGFLGAGAIIKEGHAVRGLTTAACLWVAAGIGMAVGIGFYSAALFVTAIALSNLLLLKRVERWLKKDRYRTLVVHAEEHASVRRKLELMLQKRHIRVIDLGIERDKDERRVRYHFIVAQCGGDLRDTLTEEVFSLEGVRKVSFR